MKGWQRHAHCHDVDPELFFPPGRDNSELVAAHLRAVRPICAACPVVLECLHWALETGQEHGLWAATTPTQRRRQRRRIHEQHRRAATSTPQPAEGDPEGPAPGALAALASGGPR